jgi:ribosomal protein S18 acetylase RimI-like enzyme
MIRKRIPSVDDAVIYRLVVRQLIPFTQVLSPQTEVSLTAIIQRLNRNDFTFAATGGRGAPFGFVTGTCRDRQLFVDMLALDDSHQGRGFGTALMQAAERHGRSRGCRSAYLFVDEVNPRAQRFYLGKGYTINGYESTARCYRMTKPLF